MHEKIQSKPRQLIISVYSMYSEEMHHHQYLYV